MMVCLLRELLEVPQYRYYTGKVVCFDVIYFFKMCQLEQMSFKSRQANISRHIISVNK